jgi:hypothetical protein
MKTVGASLETQTTNRKVPQATYQLRIYTLPTTEALEQYATVHWPRHTSSRQSFGVTTHGIWTDHDAEAHRLTALISYSDGADHADDRVQCTHASDWNC